MRLLAYLLSILLLCSQSVAQETDGVTGTDQTVIDEFMDLRFGMFIHWGPVTLRGTELGWSRGNQVSVEDYDNLHKEFNPVLFNADEWVKAAKEAGMKYLTVTSKHHDGFCLWPTGFSTLNIMNTPFKRDVIGELAEACKKYDIRFCVYFTVLDWHDPHYPFGSQGSRQIKATADMEKFVSTMKNQLQEIVTRYDPYILWFDGNWDSTWTDMHAREIYTFLKDMKPDLIINNRLNAIGSLEKASADHAKLTPGSIGNYATPEQRIGEFNMDVPWESCMTIGTQWSWKPNDHIKSLKECIQALVKTSAGNGNLLFNVGPMPDGRIEQRQIDRLKEMGDWLALYGESIYGTRGGPYKPNEVFAATRKGHRLYVHVFERNADTLALPALAGVKVKRAYFLKGEKVNYHQDDGGAISLQLPTTLPDENVSVIVLELNSNAGQIPVIP